MYNMGNMWGSLDMVFEKVFCENCRKDVDYNIIEEQMIGSAAKR